MNRHPHHHRIGRDEQRLHDFVRRPTPQEDPQDGLEFRDSKRHGRRPARRGGDAPQFHQFVPQHVGHARQARGEVVRVNLLVSIIILFQ